MFNFLNTNTILARQLSGCSIKPLQSLVPVAGIDQKLLLRCNYACPGKGRVYWDKWS